MGVGSIHERIQPAGQHLHVVLDPHQVLGPPTLPRRVQAAGPAEVELRCRHSHPPGQRVGDDVARPVWVDDAGDREGVDAS